MPTFPQHRNMKKTIIQKENREQEPVTDQTNNLPAISDLVCYQSTINAYICVCVCVCVCVRMYVYTHTHTHTQVLHVIMFVFQLGSLVKKRRVE